MKNNQELKQLILNANYINYKEITKEGLDIISDEENTYFFDTESCVDLPQEVVEKYELDKVDYTTIQDFATTETGSLLYNLKKNKQLKSKVYVWMFGSSNSDVVYYGNTIQEFVDFIQSIDAHKVVNGMKPTEFEIYVHNLAWDIEFFKYWLKEQQYEQFIFDATNKRKKMKNKSFDILETENTVHNAKIVFDKKKVNKKQFTSAIIFKDSMKITPISLAKISEELISIDDIFKKNSDIYNYNLIRNEKEYTPDVVEGFYQYCDIYILKEWFNQFVVVNYINEGVQPFTISQIAFDSILEKSYSKDKEEGKYNQFIDKQGKINNRKIYESHFGLQAIAHNPMYAEYITSSYKGGITTAARKYKEQAKDNNSTIKGVSIDITSSYPSQICTKPLPFGAPYNLQDGKYYNFNIFGQKYDFHFITIGFDGWNSKTKGNGFGLPVKIHNITEKEKEAIGYTPNEIYTTNLVNGKFIGNNRIEINDIKRKAKIDKLTYKYIITLTHYEFEIYERMFNFYRIENNKIERGVHFIDFISFQSETGYFKEGIEFFYRQKEIGTLEENKSMVYNSKIIINSFYGKNCSKRERQQRLYDFNKDVIGFEAINEANKNEWLDEKLYSVAYGSAITSWGRIQLMETVHQIGSDKFVYADTDSLKFADITKDELVEICERNQIKLSTTKEQKQLGGWDFEFEFDDFKAVAQKKYIYKRKGEQDFTCKCSGLPAEIRNSIKTKEQFEIGSKFIKNSKTKVIGGNLLLPTEFTISNNSIY